jgi:hypothetical protein
VRILDPLRSSNPSLIKSQFYLQSSFHYRDSSRLEYGCLQTTRRYNTGGSQLHIRRLENLKSYTVPDLRNCSVPKTLT